MKCFYLENNVVHGPYSQDELTSMIQQGAVSNEAQIWSRGQREWFSPVLWQNLVKENANPSREAFVEEKWYYATGKDPVGPFSFSELVTKLKDLERNNHAKVWCTGMDKWRKIFEVPRLVDELELSQRSIERVPLSGSTQVIRLGREHTCKVSSISENGIGIENADFLTTGDDVVLIIKSPQLPGTIRTRGEVKYVTAEGSCGLAFMHIHMEARNAIINYIRHAKQQKPQPQAKKAA